MSDSCTNKAPAVLVGAGPGRDDLITLAGADAITRAEVVIYDRLISPSLLRLAPECAEKIYVGKTPGEPSSPTQQQITDLLVKKCCQGKRVVRLKGGDPLIFGRGGKEAEALAEAGIAFEIIPGITAATAAGAFAGISLTDRRYASTVTFVTGREDPDKDDSSIDYGALAKLETLVFYMGVGQLEQITRRLVQAGRPGETPAAMVERAALPGERTVTATLETIAARAHKENIQPPALLIVGNVVRTHAHLGPANRLPLSGRTVLVTRPTHQCTGLCGELRAWGANIVEAPAIDIAPAENPTNIDKAIEALSAFDWLIVTSANGVSALRGRLSACGGDARMLAGVRIAAIGSATADALAGMGLRADLMGEAFTTESLGDAMIAAGVKGRRVLMLRADIAPPTLADRLAAAGADVTSLAAYRTVFSTSLPNGAAEDLDAGRVDWITFTSASTVETFLTLAGIERARACRLAVIGPVTADALAGRGLSADVIAKPHTNEGLVAAIVECEQADREAHRDDA